MNKYTLLFILYIIFTSLVGIQIYINIGADINIYTVKSFGIIGIIQLVLSIYTWCKIQKTVINGYNLFIITFYIFTFGQSLILPFDLVQEKRDLLNDFSYYQLFYAQIITLLFLGFFHVGALLGGNSYRYKKNNSMISISQINKLKIVGSILFIISFFPFLITAIEKYNIIRSRGYVGLYESNDVNIGFSNYLNILTSYFVPCLIILLFVYIQNKRLKNILFAVFLTYIIYTLFIGGRTGAVILAGVLIILYHLLIKEIKSSKLFITIIYSYLFISILSIISDLRLESNRTLSMYFNTFIDNFGKNNMFFDTISEMGGSMYPLLETIKLVPDIYSFRFGTTYLYASSSIIPNIGFWELHPAMVNANLGDWLQKVLNLNYGPGYSLIAEAYINFGLFGFIILFIHGLLLAKLFIYISRKETLNNPLLFTLAVIFLFLTLSTVRNSFLLTTRSVFYFILPIYAAVKYSTNKNIRNYLINNHNNKY